MTPTISVTTTPTISVTPTPSKTPAASVTPTISITPSITPTTSVCAGDAPVRFQYASTYLIEGGTANIKVLRETGHCEPDFVGCPFSVDWNTQNASNSAVTGVITNGTDDDGDYLSGSGTFYFAAGENEKTITVTGIPLTPDTTPLENDEFFFIKLSNPRSAYAGVNSFITGSNPYAVFIVEPS